MSGVVNERNVEELLARMRSLGMPIGRRSRFAEPRALVERETESKEVWCTTCGRHLVSVPDWVAKKIAAGDSGYSASCHLCSRGR